MTKLSPEQEQLLSNAAAAHEALKVAQAAAKVTLAGLIRPETETRAATILTAHQNGVPVRQLAKELRASEVTIRDLIKEYAA